VTITDLTVKHSDVIMGVGGISNDGKLTLTRCAVTHNGSEHSQVAGILNNGSLTAENCLIADNSGVGLAGAFLNRGVATITKCQFLNNDGVFGGAIHNDSAGQCSITDSFFLGNYVAGDFSNPDGPGRGGAIYNSGRMKLLRTWVSNNQSYNGSGAGLENTGSLSLKECNVTGNVLRIPPFITEPRVSFYGAGIANFGKLNGERATIAGNTIPGGPFTGESSTSEGAFGGGLYLGPGSDCKLSHCTVSGNSVGDSAGAGIFCDTNAVAQLMSCTVAQNYSMGLGDVMLSAVGGGVYNRGKVSAKNCIFAENRVSGISFGGGVGGPNFAGLLDSQGFNLIDFSLSATIVGDLTGNILDVDPLLGPLAANGGFTQTHALLPTSPVIDKGNGSGSPFDQRGLPRTVDIPSIADAADGTDIGSFEYAP